MKQIFLDITGKLDTVPELNWVDEDKGQMNFERPSIVFPAALITLTTSSNDLSKKVREGQGILTVNLCFDFMGNTNNKTPEAQRLASLSYYDIIDAVDAALQGFSGVNFNRLSQRRNVPVPRPDGYKVQQLQYAFEYHESL